MHARGRTTLKKPNLILTALGLAVGLAVALPAGAAGSRSFADPTGDSGSGPDFQRIVVSNTNTGLIRFELTYANRAALQNDDGVFVAIDSDRNRATGDPDGTEYLALVDVASGAAGLGRWTGSTYDFSIPQTTFKGDGLVVEVNRSELGNLSAFDFFVGSFGGDGEDFAPDAAEQVFTYELDLTPELRSLTATFTPRQPRAGKVFALAGVRVRTDTETVRPDRRTCTAKLAGRTLRPIAPCRWRLPKNAKRKLLVVAIRVTYQGVTGTAQPYRFRVRP
jgi:hypothetical protein